MINKDGRFSLGDIEDLRTYNIDEAMEKFLEEHGKAQQQTQAQSHTQASSLELIAMKEVKVAKQDYDALSEILAQIGKKPEELYSEYNTGRIRVNNSRVYEARLHNLGLKTLPVSIGNLSGLGILYLNYNYLASLPDSIANLSNLKELYLHSNKIASLPDSIGYLSSLNRLWLQNNQLASLPVSIGNLTNLKELYLGNNKRTFLRQGLIKKLRMRGVVVAI